MRKIQMNTTLYLHNKFKNILFANKHANILLMNKTLYLYKIIQFNFFLFCGDNRVLAKMRQYNI